MQATAHSNTISKVNPDNRTKPATDTPDETICPPSNAKRRCPAIILAISRTANVKGRIISLIDSITTINGISMPGVPSGTKCPIL